MSSEKILQFRSFEENSNKINVKELREKALQARFRKLKGIDKITGPKIKMRIDYFQKKLDLKEKKYDSFKQKQEACMNVNKMLLPKKVLDENDAKLVVDILEKAEVYPIKRLEQLKSMRPEKLTDFLNSQMSLAINYFAMNMGFLKPEIDKYKTEIDRLNNGMEPFLLSNEEEIEYQAYESKLVAEPRGSISYDSEVGRGMMLSVGVCARLFGKLKLKDGFEISNSMNLYIGKFRKHEKFEDMLVKMVEVYDKGMLVNKRFFKGLDNTALALLVMNYQKENGLKVDGKPGKNTIKSILSK